MTAGGVTLSPLGVVRPVPEVVTDHCVVRAGDQSFRREQDLCGRYLVAFDHTNFTAT